MFLFYCIFTKFVCSNLVCQGVKHHSIKVCPCCQLMQLPNFPLFSCSAILRWSNFCRSSKNHYKEHNVKLSFEGFSSIAIRPILSSISLGAIVSDETRCTRTKYRTIKNSMYDVIDWELEKDVDITFMCFSFVVCNYWWLKRLSFCYFISSMITFFNYISILGEKSKLNVVEAY